jgi:hypothetical protein
MLCLKVPNCKESRTLMAIFIFSVMPEGEKCGAFYSAKWHPSRPPSSVITGYVIGRNLSGRAGWEIFAKYLHFWQMRLRH